MRTSTFYMVFTIAYLLLGIGLDYIGILILKDNAMFAMWGGMLIGAYCGAFAVENEEKEET